MKSHVTEPLRPRREHVWVRLQREPESGDYAAALTALLLIVFIAVIVGALGPVPS